jgi:hypothetical protein
MQPPHSLALSVSTGRAVSKGQKTTVFPKDRRTSTACRTKLSLGGKVRLAVRSASGYPAARGTASQATEAPSHGLLLPGDRDLAPCWEADVGTEVPGWTVGVRAAQWRAAAISCAVPVAVVCGEAVTALTIWTSGRGLFDTRSGVSSGRDRLPRTTGTRASRTRCLTAATIAGRARRDALPVTADRRRA